MSPERNHKEADGELLQEYADSQDAQAFAEIARRHGPMVLGVSKRITRNTHDAEDVVQEAFVELTRTAGSITSLPGWLHRVATNIAKTKIRTAIRRREREQASIEIRDAGPSSWEEISPHVDNALAELPPEMREVLVLHFLEGVGQAEIAQRLGINQSTVSRRMRWGVEQLRTRLRRTGVVASFSLLSMLLADNAAAATVPKTLVASFGKMALAGLGSSESAAGASTTLLHGEMARAAAVIVVSVLGIGALTYFFARGGEADPLRSVAADYRLDGSGAHQAGAQAAGGTAAGALAGPRDRAARGFALNTDDAGNGDTDFHTDRLHFATGRARGAGAADIGDLPVLVDEEAAEEPAVTATDRGGVGSAGPAVDMMAGHRGAYRPLVDGGAAGLAGGESVDGAGFGANNGTDSASGVYADAATGSGNGIDNSSAVSGGSGTGWPGQSGTGTEQTGESSTGPDASINSFAANADMLWAFTDLGLYAYDWDSGKWLNAPGGHHLSDPTRNIRVDGAGNVIMTVYAGGQAREQIIGWIAPPAAE